MLSCSDLDPPTAIKSDLGSASVYVKIGKVGALGKKATIQLDTLYLTLTAPGETTRSAKFPLSANSEQTFSQCFTELASLHKIWTLSAEAKDMLGTVIHSGSISFIVPARRDTSITLTLGAKYSMLKANFFPIRDSVTHCELLVDGVIKDDSSFAKQSLVGDTVEFAFDYLQTNIAQRVRLDVYGQMWGFDTLLYTSDTLIAPQPGVNASYNLTLRWVGPALPPPGSATMIVVLGAVGTQTINGEFEDHFSYTSGFLSNRGIDGSFTVTKLNNGKILVAGGADFINSSYFRSAELYDPVTGMWSLTGNMNVARASHCAVLLQDGRVLVAGGYNEAYGSGIASAEIYDPASGAWTSTSGLAQGRGNPCAILLNSGEVLVTAGAVGYGDIYYHSTEIFNSVSQTWRPAGNMSIDRRGSPSTRLVLLSNGKALIAGGANTRTCEMFDPATETWSTTGSMIGERHEGFCLASLQNGKVLAAGGNAFYTAVPTAEAELFDPTTGTWQSTTALPQTRTCYYANTLENGKVLITGGVLGYTWSTVQVSALLYNPENQSWEQAGTLKTARGDHIGVSVQHGRILLLGGLDANSTTLSTAEIYHQ
jgi:hypothetical protein